MTTVDVLAKEVDVFYLMWAAALVFSMHLGFAMLEAGTIGVSAVRNVLFKNLIAVTVGGLAFWLLGYGIAYGGDDDNGFMGEASDNGEDSFAFRVDDTGSDMTPMDVANAGYTYAMFFFQYAFAAAAATIVSGAVAGRIKLTAFILYTFILCSFVYPVVAHWVWDGSGWISAFNTDDTFQGGMVDFAGSGVVHLTGGISALVASSILGPRTNRFDSAESSKSFSSHSAPLQVLGTMILWVGWYGFNGGSTLGISTYSRDAGRVVLTTTLSACAAACTGTLVTFFVEGKWDLGCLCNSILAGLVSITAGCSVVEPFAAIIIGAIGGLVCYGASKALVALRIDDPLDAFPVHGACGAFGCIMVGLFAADKYTYNLDANAGLFYDGDFHLLGVQIVGVLTIALWVGGTMALLFGAMYAAGILRVDPDHEGALDESEHEGPAYVIVANFGGPAAHKASKAAVTPVGEETA